MAEDDRPDWRSPFTSAPQEQDASGLRGYAYGVEDEIRSSLDFGEVAQTLWKGKIWIAAITLSIVLVGIAYVVFASPVYQAFTVLSVSTTHSQVPSGPSGDVSDVIGLSDRRIEDEVMVIEQSVDLRRRVASVIQAESNVTEDERRLSVLYDENGDPYSIDELVYVLEDHFAVVAEGENQKFTGIRIVTESGLPAEAALIANTFASEYINQARDASRLRLRSMSVFLDEQEGKLRSRVTGLEDSLRVFMTTEGAIALDQEASQMVIQIAQLEALRDQTRIDREMMESSLQSLEEEIRKIEPNLVRRVASNVDEELAGIQEQITALELRAGEYYQRDPSLRADPSRNSTLMELVGRITALQARVDELSERYVNEVLAAGGVNPSSSEGGLTYVAQQRRKLAESRISLQALEAKENVVGQRLAAYRGRLNRIPAQAIEIARLERELKSAENLYVYIVEKFQEVTIALESEIGYAEIIRPASRPRVPARPNSKRALIVSIMFGLVAGGGFVLLRSSMDNRIESSGDLRRLGYQIIGTVPNTNKMPKVTSPAAFAETLNGLGGIDESLTVLTNPLSIASEAYRRICTSIRYGRRTNGMSVLLLTSPEPQDGKTTTAVNIALAMAEAGNRTALVDMDLRLPRIHALLQLPNTIGVSDILESDDVGDLGRFETAIPNLTVIPAGVATTNPSKLLGSARLPHLIAQLKESFDVVIVDTPPVLVFNDARVIAARCDSVIMVAAADKTHVRAFEDVVRVLEDVGARIFGCVLNMVSAQPEVKYYSRYAAHYFQENQENSSVT